MGLYYINGKVTDNPYEDWQKSYAYFPKKIKGKWVWLDYYYWRLKHNYYATGNGYEDTQYVKVYGTLFDVLKG